MDGATAGCREVQAGRRETGVVLTATLVALFGIGIAGSAGDLTTTWVALRRGAREGNPVQRWIFDRFGYRAILVTGPLLYTLFWAVAFRTDQPAWAVLTFAAVLWITVANNIRVMTNPRR